MKPGRELDALVLAKVMDPNGQTRALETWNKVTGAHSIEFPDIPHYSTSIADAWQVAQKITDMKHVDDFVIHLSPSELGECEVEIRFWVTTQDDSYVAGPFFLLGKSAPHAICLAALKAIEHRAK